MGNLHLHRLERLQQCLKSGNLERAQDLLDLWLGQADKMPPKPCLRCGEKAWSDYMVTDTVWAEAGLKHHDGFLHVDCLERVLGRKLRIEDFKDVPINRPLRFGYRMAEAA